MRTNCICDSAQGVVCAHHAKLLYDIKLPRGPEPPTEEAILEARTRARVKLRYARMASTSDHQVDQALEAVAEFVRLRNYV